MLYLWKFYRYFGRIGELSSLFVATEEEVDKMIGREAHFGEALGKHSDVCCTLDEDDFTKLNISPDAVSEVSNYLGYTWSGYNPQDYIRTSCDECGKYIYIGEGEEVFQAVDSELCEMCFTEWKRELCKKSNKEFIAEIEEGNIVARTGEFK